MAATSTHSPRWWAWAVAPGPEVHRRDARPRPGGPRRSRPAWARPRGRPGRAAAPPAGGRRRPGRTGARSVISTSAPKRRASSSTSRAASLHRPVGREAEVQVERAAVGHHVAGPPSLDARDRRSPRGRAARPSVASRGARAGELREQRPGPVHGVLPLPRARRVGRTPGEGEGGVERADAAQRQPRRRWARGRWPAPAPCELRRLAPAPARARSRGRAPPRGSRGPAPGRRSGPRRGSRSASSIATARPDFMSEEPGATMPPALAPRRAAVLGVDRHGVEVAAQRHERPRRPAPRRPGRP